jgi:hypothetical protein
MISAMFPDNKYIKNFAKFWKTERPLRTARTMVLKKN